MGGDTDMTTNQVTGPQPGSRFTVGSHQIKYTAIDGSGNQGYCEFRVIVQDREKPTVIGCPKGQEITVYKTNDWSAHPHWTAPRGRDNVDGLDVKVDLVAGLQPGEKFTVGAEQDKNSATMIYHIWDKAGNIATCQFEITLVKDKATEDGKEFEGDLETQSPQELEQDEMAEEGKYEAMRAQKLNQQRLKERAEEMKRKREDAIKASANKAAKGFGKFKKPHISAKHEKRRIETPTGKWREMSERLRKAGMQATESAEKSESTLWTVLKALMLVVAFIIPAAAILYFAIEYFLAPQKGKRLETSKKGLMSGVFGGNK